MDRTILRKTMARWIASQWPSLANLTGTFSLRTLIVKNLLEIELYVHFFWNSHCLWKLFHALWFCRYGTLLAVGCNDGRIVVWDFLTRGIAKIIQAHVHPVCSLSWSRSGRKVVSASTDNTVTLWDVLSGRRAHRKSHFFGRLSGANKGQWIWRKIDSPQNWFWGKLLSFWTVLDDFLFEIVSTSSSGYSDLVFSGLWI